MSASVYSPQAGSFVRIDLDASNMSINAVTEQLGYHHHQLKIHHGSGERIYCVAFKIFTKDIVYVFASGTEPSIDGGLVRDYINDYSPNESWEVESHLKEAIEERSLSQAYLAEVLRFSVSEPDAVIPCPALGYTLVFEGGLLVDYYSSDGLNEWAKSWKASNTSLFNRYLNAARKRWGSDEALVLNEVNQQAEAFASIPQGMMNPYIHQYRLPDGTIDFVKLRAMHYN